MALFRSEPAATGPTAEDLERFTQLSQIVTQGVKQFARIGLALEEIRDRQLYRCEFETFEECCRQQWHMSLRHANRLIDAAAICRELGPTGRVPENEHQARVLSSLPESARKPTWEEAIAAGEPSVTLHKAVSKRLKKKGHLIKPIRVRVPGASVLITPNKRFTDIKQTLTWAISKLTEPRDKAA